MTIESQFVYFKTSQNKPLTHSLLLEVPPIDGELVVVIVYILGVFDRFVCRTLVVLLGGFSEVLQELVNLGLVVGVSR